VKIIVPVKQVPESEELRYDPATRTLAREGVTSIINAFDKRALTEAVRLRSLYGGEITAITMGPPQARDALVECLGRGVDRAIHLSDRALAGSDTLATARTLAAAMRRMDYDLILPGKYTTDSETGQVGPELAELLDLPQVTGATAIALADDGTLRVKRETDTGFDEMVCPLPALLTAAEHLIKPVKTGPALVEEGKRRLAEDPSLIESWGIADLGLSPEEVGLSGSPTQVLELRAVEIERERTRLSGDPLSAADSLLLMLGDRGFGPGKGALSRELPTLPPLAAQPDPSKSVWAVAEWLAEPGGGRRLRAVSLELAGEAARLTSEVGGEAVAVLLGTEVAPFAAELARNGASTILLGDAAELSNYDTERFAWILAGAIRQHKPWAVLLPATAFGRDLAPRVAARLGLGLTGDCTGLEIDRAGRLLQLKPAFGGQVIAPIASSTLPNMATVRPGMLPRYAPDPSRQPNIVRLEVEGLPASRTQVVSSSYEGEAGLALDNARLVVCVGSGVGGPEAIRGVERVALALGAWMGLAPGEVAVGGTRKVVDDGWLPQHQQIGTSGRAVAPDLYVALGVRGPFNHTVGILRSGTVVAVNNDPQAPIFEASDIGIVGDWRKFADALELLLTASD
jgi:electron transfer flavoprotein alpha subunit